MNKVISVLPLTEKKLAIVLSDGRKGIFDVTPFIRSEFFKQLENDEYFNKVRVFFTGIGWPEGQDLGPDTIEAEMHEVKD